MSSIDRNIHTQYMTNFRHSGVFQVMPWPSNLLEIYQIKFLVVQYLKTLITSFRSESKMKQYEIIPPHYKK